MNELLGKSLTKKVERLEAFEERLSVRFENISIKAEDDGWFTLFCEVHSANGSTIEEDIDIECVIYDEEGSILDKENTRIFKDEFFGFEIIDIAFQEDGMADRVGKIRLYPKK